MRRLRAAAALLALAAWPDVAGAQQVAPDTAQALIRPPVDASRLRPERRVYRLTVLRGGLPTNAGERTVTVREGVHGGAPAWTIVERRFTPTAVSADSVVASRAALAPLHWEGTVAGARLVAGIGADTLYGAVDAPSGRRTVVVGGVGGAVLNAGMLEALVPLLPLQTGWTTTLPLVLIASDGGRVLPLRLAVEREETLQLPSGRFDCWVVALASDRPLKTLWVSRDGRGVVRSEERLPDVDGAILEQSLLSIGPP
jgi:hypothetical protein